MRGKSSAPCGRSQGGLLVVTVLAVWVAACGAHGAVAVNRLPGSAPASPASPGGAKVPTQPQRMTGETLESFMAKVRHLSTEARADKVAPVTLEGTDPDLRSALAASVALPSPESYRALAAAYRRLMVVDKAHGALAQALELDPRDARTFDALARLWRDAGLPHLALGDAYRAVHYSNGRPEIRNTLGTVLQALGRSREALAEFTRVVEKDPLAAYGWNNLCYGWLVRGRPAEATRACQRALSLRPSFAAAQNNLGLARAQAGDMAGARRAFELAGHAARADFNLGMAQAATGRYSQAAQSFERAHAAQPGWRDAVLLESQAKRAAYQVQHGGESR
jgi:tetratricopeptide (TPR) repeat protein